MYGKGVRIIEHVRNDVKLGYGQGFRGVTATGRFRTAQEPRFLSSTFTLTSVQHVAVNMAPPWAGTLLSRFSADRVDFSPSLRPHNQLTEESFMKWWMQVLSFILFYVVSMNLLKLLGVGAFFQLAVGIFSGVVGTMVLNARAAKKSGSVEASKDTSVNGDAA